MPQLWVPDFCPPGATCCLEIESDWSSVRAFVRCCPHHQSLRDKGMADQQVFEAILQSSRVKEAARYAAKLEMKLDKKHPGLPYTVDPAGNFTILTGATGLVKARVRSAAAAAVAQVARPAGTSSVIVA